MYSDEEVEAAKQLVQDLESFTNRDLSHIANLSRVTDKYRLGVITELLIKEFGQGILSKGVFNPFGSSEGLCSTTSYRRPDQDSQPIEL